jgi:hypothetical protein
MVPIRTEPNKRVQQLKRSFQRVLRKRPTMVQRTAMERAAVLSYRAELAARDPTADLDAVLRADKAAAAARAMLGELLSRARNGGGG